MEAKEEEIKSDNADCFTIQNLKISDDNSGDKKEGSPVQKKNIMSNKERARKARQRKKKYYEDLEKRVEYLEHK